MGLGFYLGLYFLEDIKHGKVKRLSDGRSESNA